MYRNPGSTSSREEPALSEDSRIFLEILQKRKTALQQLISTQSLTEANLPDLMKLRNDAEEFQKRNPIKRAEASDLAVFAQNAIDSIKLENKNQKGFLKTRKDQDKDFTANDSQAAYSVPFRGDSPFSGSAVRRFNGLNLSGEGAEQTRMLKELKDIVEKSTSGIHQQLDRMENRFNADLNQVNNRLSQLENNGTTARTNQARTDDTLTNISRTVNRTDDQCASLTRKMDDLLNQRQQQPISAQPTGPLSVNLNVTGLPSGLTFNTTPATAPEVSVPPAIVSHKPVAPTVAQVAPPAPTALSVNVPRGPGAGLLDHPGTASTGPLLPEPKGTGTVAWSGPSTTKSPVPPKLPISSTETLSPRQKPTTTAPAFGATPSANTGAPEAVKPSLFGQFPGFGSTTAAPLPPNSPFTSSPFSSSGGGKNAFAALAESSAGGFQKTDKPFPGAGTVLFGGAQPTKAAVAEDDDDENEGTGQEDSYVPTADFKPLVSLPVVQVKTGEENFEKLFVDRCKLFRFDQTTKEWKERGLGDLSIQRCTDAPPGSVIIRILMRWEKTHKICAHHQFTPNMKLEAFSEADQKAWKWFAHDFSDGELKPSLFGIRFKTKEQADKFKIAFDDAVKQVTAASGSTGSPTKVPVKAEPKTADKPAAAVPSWAELSKPKGGTWQCQECYSSNPADKTACLACQATRPGHSAGTGASSLTTLLDKNGAAAPSTAFSFGAPSGFAPAVSSAAPSAGFSFGYPSGEQPKSDGKSIFGGTKLETVSNPFSGFSLNTNSTGTPGFSTPQKSSVPPFSFGSGAGFSFNIETKPSSATKKADQESSGEEDNDVESERHDLVFKPVVKLPDNVTVLTGEENEMELYSQRAKLYRFVDSEWKERGLGDIKMMKELGGNKIRLLMRREKILKVCLNHFIGPSMDLLPMPSNKNAWIWSAEDFSEGTLIHERFSIKFKHDAHWKEFKDLVERAKDIASGAADNNVEKFDRVEVSEATTVPIAESGKKAVEAMSVHNPFADASSTKTASSPPIVEEPMTSPTVVRSSVLEANVGAPEDSGEPQTLWGDTSYKFFSVIFNGRGEAVAIGVPSLLGFFRLKSPADIKVLIAVDAKSEESVRNEIARLTEKIDPTDATANVPEAVRRYWRAIKIKEYGDDEAWRSVLFERQLTLTKKVHGNFKPLGLGKLRITRDGDYDSPYLIQHFGLTAGQEEEEAEEGPELAVHSIVHDCNLEVDRTRFTAQWTANDFAKSGDKAERADFQVRFSNAEALAEFEQTVLDGITVAEESDVSLRTTM